MTTQLDSPQGVWLSALRVYLGTTVVVHFVWETLQLPLYTIWETGTAGEQAFAIAHCTAGDLLIATSCLIVALVVAGRADWPTGSFLCVAAVAIVIGVLYTAFSEWLNVAVRGSWAYAARMPVIRLGTISVGLSPLMQWIVVPALSFLSVHKLVSGTMAVPGQKEAS